MGRGGSHASDSPTRATTPVFAAVTTAGVPCGCGGPLTVPGEASFAWVQIVWQSLHRGTDSTASAHHSGRSTVAASPKPSSLAIAAAAVAAAAACSSVRFSTTCFLAFLPLDLAWRPNGIAAFLTNSRSGLVNDAGNASV